MTGPFQSVENDPEGSWELPWKVCRAVGTRRRERRGGSIFVRLIGHSCKRLHDPRASPSTPRPRSSLDKPLSSGKRLKRDKKYGIAAHTSSPRNVHTLGPL